MFGKLEERLNITLLVYYSVHDSVGRARRAWRLNYYRVRKSHSSFCESLRLFGAQEEGAKPNEGWCQHGIVGLSFISSTIVAPFDRLFRFFCIFT